VVTSAGFRRGGAALLAALASAAVLAGAAGRALAACGPFTDVSDAVFCPFVLEIFTLGITTGTTPTTYDSSANVSRLQMAAFLSRTVDGVLRRGSDRALRGQFWTVQNDNLLDGTTVGSGFGHPAFDGLDVWVPDSGGTVARVRGSDGTLLATWTGATGALAALSAAGKVFVTGLESPGRLYRIDPRQPPGAVTTVASNLGDFTSHLDFDGARIWTTNQGTGTGSVSIVTPAASIPWTVTTVTAGFIRPFGVVFDGSNVWVTDINANTLLKLSSTGAVLQTVTVYTRPTNPVFDGANIWVPAQGATETPSGATVVRASTGAVLATLTGNGMNEPLEAAFDGERVIMTNLANLAGSTVSLWKAADLSPIGVFSTGAGSKPFGVCSDGAGFWITVRQGQLLRF
jgi:hypothetical protein